MFNSKRVKFNPGKQHLFIKKCLSKLGITNSELARLLKINIRTLTDWKREKFTISLTAIKFLSKKLRCSMPKKIKIREPFWYVSNGSSAGGIAAYKKYGRIGGDPEIRKKKWHEWWVRIGRLQSPLIKRRKIKIPSKNIALAEFVGIMMGDGGISKNQVTVTLHNKDDYEYSLFVAQLIKNLFGLIPGIYNHKKARAMRLVISRINLVDFCEKIGLKIGDKIKQKLDVPIWIKRNACFQKSCVRGLIDTDGCLVIHKYKVNDKQYCYKKLNFCSASKPLVKSIIEMLRVFDFRPRLSHNGRNVWIDNQNEVKRYFQAIGSNNPKHKERLSR